MSIVVATDIPFRLEALIPPLLEGVVTDGSQLSSSPGIALARKKEKKNPTKLPAPLEKKLPLMKWSLGRYKAWPCLSSNISKEIFQLQGSSGGSGETLVATA